MDRVWIGRSEKEVEKRKGEAEGARFHRVSSARLRGLQRLRLFLVKLGS